MKNTLIKQSLTALVAVGVLSLTNTSALAAELAGTVQGANQPIAAATVTLYEVGEGAPSQVAQTKTDANGKFRLDAKPAPKGSVFYLVAKGPKEPARPDVVTRIFVASQGDGQRTHHGRLDVLRRPVHHWGSDLRESARAADRRGNVPNLVNLQTGSWGTVLIEPQRHAQHDAREL